MVDKSLWKTVLLLQKKSVYEKNYAMFSSKDKNKEQKRLHIVQPILWKC